MNKEKQLDKKIIKRKSLLRKRKRKIMGQIKCYNIKYSVNEEDLLANQSFNSIDGKLKKVQRFKSIDDLHNSLPKEVTIDDEIKSEIDDEIANAISDETGWLVESFDWKVEEEQRPTESDNTLEKFMKGEK